MAGCLGGPIDDKGECQCTGHRLVRQPGPRVYVPGTFDCLHVGHINLLDFAASLGEVWVGLNPDWFCEQYKRRPVYSLEDRMRIVESLRQVDEVIENAGGYDSKPAILECAPTYIVHGDDWTGAAYLRQLGVTEEWIRNRGIELRFPPYTQGVSTTEIIQTMGAEVLMQTVPRTGRIIHGDALE